MAIRKYRINPMTGKLDRVATPEEIEGDYMEKEVFDVDDDAIIDKAESIDDGEGNTASAIDIKDAVTKKHTQDTDTKLDEGGANEIAVTELSKKLLANVEYYIATDGSDVTGDGTTGNPFATANHALSLIPKNLNGYNVNIYFKDGTYNNVLKTTIKDFYGGGRIEISSESWDSSLVLLNMSSEAWSCFSVEDCVTRVGVYSLSIRVNKNNANGITFSHSLSGNVEDIKIGDTAGNTGTYGLSIQFSIVEVDDISDIDAEKVTTGIYVVADSIVIEVGTTSIGDTQYNVVSGLVTDNPIIRKVDYDDAISKKHTQNSDTDLDATFELTFVKKTDTINVLSDITSAGADIEDAVTKRHTQDTDTQLIDGALQVVSGDDILIPNDLEVEGKGTFAGLNITEQISISTTDEDGIVFGSLGTATKAIDLSGCGLSGTGDYYIYIDADNYWGGYTTNERLKTDYIECGYLQVGQITGAGVIYIQRTANNDVWFFQEAGSWGETPAVRIYGYREGDALRYISMAVSDVADDRFDFTNIGTYYFDGDMIVTGDNKAVSLTIDAITIDEFSIDGTLGDNSDTAIPTEKAVKTYADTKLANILEDTTPELGGELDAGLHTIGFTEQALEVLSGGDCPIDWKLSNKAKLTVDNNVTITFVNPSNPCSLTLVIVQDGTGSHVVTLPATIKWSGSSAPTLSTGANDIDIISLYFDGSVYYAVASLDFGTV